LVAENADHSPSDLDGFGWHGTMNYVGFARPIWAWLNKPNKKIDNFMGLPVPIPTFDGQAMSEMMRSFSAGIPWRSFVASMLLLDSHDTARFRTVVGKEVPRHVAGATLLLTYPGVPSIFAGDELGLEGEWGEDSRRTIDWDHPKKWNHDLFGEYKKLIAIRKNSPALCDGGIRWIQTGPNSIAYLRESTKESVLVFVARSAGRYRIDLKPFGYTVKETLYGPTATSSTVSITSKGAISGIWRLK
jgi:alpha-glucosidase